LPDAWNILETDTHQDHVIAHVIDATVLGYFICDEVLYLLLNIGFIWNIFLDGQMGLLPQTVAVNELEIDGEARADIRSDIDLLSAGQRHGLKRTKAMQADYMIREVSLLGAEDKRRLIIRADEGSVVIETSLATREILIREIAGDE
jgi:hypothetical protein